MPRLPASVRTYTVQVAAREYVWLWDYRHGKSTEEIASDEGLSERRVRYGLARARSMESPSGVTLRAAEALRAPRLEPLFTVVAFVPAARCPHNRPLRKGSVFCCMVCHQSGMDAHPALKRSPATDPRPEPKPKAQPVPKAGKLTRKQRRALQFGPASKGVVQ